MDFPQLLPTMNTSLAEYNPDIGGDPGFHLFQIALLAVTIIIMFIVIDLYAIPKIEEEKK